MHRYGVGDSALLLFVCTLAALPPFFPLLIISSLYESDIGIAFNASSILIACTGTYSPLIRTPPPVNENNSLDVFKSKCRFLFESVKKHQQDVYLAQFVFLLWFLLL